jgi:hypothetical protein
MADSGLFIGWGQPVRGKEAKGLDVFNEVLAFNGKLQEAGEIESFEVALLAPHGGGLNGFILVRGSEEQMSALQVNDGFERLTARAGLVVDEFGVVDAAIGDGMGEALNVYREAVDDLA